MTAAAIPDTRAYDQLSEAELDDGQRALAGVMGNQMEASRARWLRRLVLTPEGWRLAVRKPVHELAEQHRHTPWLAGQGPLASGGPGVRLVDDSFPGMLSTTVHLAIEEAVQLLNSDRSPEAEIERRQRLWDGWWARHDSAIADHQARAAADIKRAAEYKAARPQRWAALPRDMKEMYIAAERSSGLTPARALVELAKAKAMTDADLSKAEVPYLFEEL